MRNNMELWERFLWSIGAPLFASGLVLSINKEYYWIPAILGFLSLFISVILNGINSKR